MSDQTSGSPARQAQSTFLRSWYGAIKLFWRSTWRIDRSKLTALTAIRGLIGFILPLALGVATRQIVIGVSIAGGASLLASVGINYNNQVRLRTLFFCCVSIALGAFIGSVTSDIVVLPILVIGVLGFASGMLVAINPSVADVGMQSVIAMILLSHFALDPWHAFLQAALMFVGALLQLLLEVFFSPWHRTDAERLTMANVFEHLAAAVMTSGEDVEPYSESLSEALTQAQATLLDSNDNSPQGKVFFVLHDQAEQMRLILIVLRNLRQRLLNERGDNTEKGLLYLDLLLQELSNELHDVSRQLTLKGRALRKQTPGHLSNEKIRSVLAQLKREQAQATEQRELLADILTYCNSMVDLLYRIKKLAWTWRHTNKKILAAYTIHRRSAKLKLYDIQETLRSHLTLRSTACRHAIRLGVTLALATAIYHLPGFPIGRGYWIPLTAFIILKPDFKSTFTRGVARMLGTLVGVILTTLLIATLKPTLDMLIVIDAVVAYIAFSVLFVNYTLFSVFTTIEAVILLAFVTPQPLTNVTDRAIDTLLGGLLALLVFLIWPTWERSHVYQNVATRLEALRLYFVAVMEAYIYPSTYNADFMLHLRRELRLSHSNADASVERIRQEPVVNHGDINQARGLLEAINAMSFNILALEAYLATDFVSPDAVRYQLRLYTNEIDQAMQQLIQALREQQPVSISAADVQAALQALKDAEKSKAPSAKKLSLEQILLLSEAEKIVRNIDIMYHLLPNT